VFGLLFLGATHWAGAAVTHYVPLADGGGKDLFFQRVNVGCLFLYAGVILVFAGQAICGIYRW
jgi:hypothetical protein